MRSLEAMDLASGSNRAAMGATLNKRSLAQIRVPLPPLPEQRRIAAILDHADALRAKRRQVLAHLDSLTQSIFHDMFGEHPWSAEYGTVIASGPTNGLYRPASDYGSGTPILRIDSFDHGEIHTRDLKRVRIDSDTTARFRLATGDIVVNRVNALSHLGKSAVVENLSEPTVYESNMMRISLDLSQALPRFVIVWLQTEKVRRQILRKAKKAINQASINQTDVRSLLMPLPELHQQRVFAERVERVNAQRSAIQRALAADDELFASLQSRAFAGEL